MGNYGGVGGGGEFWFWLRNEDGDFEFMGCVYCLEYCESIEFNCIYKVGVVSIRVVFGGIN